MFATMQKRPEFPTNETATRFDNNSVSFFWSSCSPEERWRFHFLINLDIHVHVPE